MRKTIGKLWRQDAKSQISAALQMLNKITPSYLSDLVPDTFSIVTSITPDNQITC